MGTPLPTRTSSSTSISGLRSSPLTALSSPSGSNQRNSRSVLSDKYILGEELGRGAYGQVFKGIDTRTGDCVAIKQLSLSGISAGNLQSIMLEIELLKNLNHKNIVKYVGSFKTRTHLYIILEFMENGSLASVIKPSKFGAFPESLVATYIAQVLQGLAYLHQQGVVHRDIKGANILTTKEGIVKLADFGVAAKLTDVEDGGDNMRQSVVGTPYWMAPEVIEMTSVTAASDIWSVGCLAIELLTGSPPYFEHAPMSALFRIVQDDHPPLPLDISADMADFLLSCFHKNPQRRPEAAALLNHRWIINHRRTLRASWTRTQGLKARSGRTDAHASVATVVERILQLESSAEPSAPSSLQDLEAAFSPIPSGPPSNRSFGRGRTDVHDSTLKDTTESSLHTGHDRAVDSATEMSLHVPLQPISDEIAEAPAPLGKKGRPPALDKTIIDASSTSSLSTPTPASESGGTSLAALLQQVAAPMNPSYDQGGEDLVAWLEKRELTTRPVHAQPTATSPAETYPEGNASRHQEAAEVRRLAASLRPPSSKGPVTGTSSSGANSARETTVIDACQQLVMTLRAQPEQKAVFVGEDGIAALMELLEERSAKVTLGGLELANALVAGDDRFLDALCLAGALPLVCRLASHTWPRPIRLQAALFLQQCCQAGRPTAIMLVACQGLPTLVGLVEDSFAENGHLTTIGVGCIWRILELHVHTSLNHLCRLLSFAGLAHRLARTLCAVNSEYLYAAAQESAGNGLGFGEGSGGALRKHASASSLLSPDTPSGSGNGEDASRATSHAHASTSALTPGSRVSTLKYGRPPPSPGVSTAFKAGPGKLGSQHRRTMSGSTAASVELLNRLLNKMANLLLLLSHGDSTVKGWICRRETVLLLLETMRSLELGPLLILFRCFKNLTGDPSMLQPLQDAGTIPALLPYLTRQESHMVQLEALRAMYNLCRISRTRQEAAAVAGIIPRLTALAAPPPPSNAQDGEETKQLRYLAVSLLCGMAHSTQRTRAELWAHNGLELLLQLLKEEEWQSPALDAMAIWLSEDPNRIEARLAHRDAIQRFVFLFSSYTGPGNNEALDRLLDPFLRILRRSRKVCMELGTGGLVPLVVEMLRHSNALTALRLLQVVHHLYEQQPRPKEFITQHPIAQQLRHMASADDNVSVLVQKQAQNLLNAFQVNNVF